MLDAQTNFRVRMASFIDGLPSDEAVLIPLYEAYRAAHDTLTSLSKQKQIQGMAVDIIASESSRMSDFACAVATRLSQLPSIRESWRERFLESLVSHVFFVGGSASDALRVQAVARGIPGVADTLDSEEPSAHISPPLYSD